MPCTAPPPPPRHNPDARPGAAIQSTPPSAASIVEVVRLVEAACQGDGRAWVELHQRFAGLLHNTIHRSFHLDGPDAEDVRQLVWLRVVSNINRLTEPRTFPAWLKMIATRECIRHLAKSGRGQLPFGELPDPEATPTWSDRPADPADHAVLLVLAEQLHAACAHTGDQSRRVLALLLQPTVPSQRELAAHLGVPLGSVAFHKRRAIAELQRVLGVAEADPSSTVDGAERPNRAHGGGQCRARTRQPPSTSSKQRSASAIALSASSRRP